MTCQGDKCGIAIEVTAVQIVINQHICSYRNIYDTCDETLGMLALAGCVSQAPSYANETDACDQTVGMYALAGCTGTIPAIVDAYAGEMYGLTPIGEE